jgi:hypothetical protein
MTDYQKVLFQMEHLNRAQLKDLKKFLTLTYMIKTLTQPDLKNLIEIIDTKLQKESKNSSAVDGIEIEV